PAALIYQFGKVSAVLYDALPCIQLTHRNGGIVAVRIAPSNEIFRGQPGTPVFEYAAFLFVGFMKLVVAELGKFLFFAFFFIAVILFLNMFRERVKRDSELLAASAAAEDFDSMNDSQPDFCS